MPIAAIRMGDGHGAGEPVNPSVFLSSQHRAESFELGLPTENVLAFSGKAILPISEELLPYSPE